MNEPIDHLAGGIEKLRKEQAALVMPLIGPLMDALEALPNDTRGAIEDEAPDLFECLAAIQRVL